MLLNDGTKCSCTKVKCIRHGDCEACIEYHQQNRRKPYCIRNHPKMYTSSPALGLIFGVPVGAVLGMILHQNIAVGAGIGAGLGLILGAAANLFFDSHG